MAWPCLGSRDRALSTSICMVPCSKSIFDIKALLLRLSREDNPSPLECQGELLSMRYGAMERESRRMIGQGSHELHECTRMITKPLIIRVNLSDSCDSWLLADAQT